MMRTILVTGAAGGIGQAVAERLLHRGDHVIACARKADQLDGLAKAGATVLAIDVANDGSVRSAFAGIAALDALVHCAAVAPLGTVEFTPPETVADIFNVNTLGALRMLQAAVPLLRLSSSGRLVLVSSLWGQVSGPFVSSYAASKHATEAIADSFRRENGGKGVQVSVVEPGVVLTKMFGQQLPDLDRQVAALGAEEQRLYGALYRDHRALLARAGRGATTADHCAKIIVRCLDAQRPRPRYVVGKDAKAMVTMGRVLSDRALDRVFSLLYKGKPA